MRSIATSAAVRYSSATLRTPMRSLPIPKLRKSRTEPARRNSATAFVAQSKAREKEGERGGAEEETLSRHARQCSQGAAAA
jgi:hypothetical protein